MKKILSILTVLVLLLALAVPAAAARNDAFAAEILRLTNAERASRGLPPLNGTNSNLNNAAQRRAQEIATHFSHTRPNGTNWGTVLTQFNVPAFSFAGENLARSAATPVQAMQVWMDSPGHRGNILGSFTHIGIGVHRVGNTYHWVQLLINDGTAPVEDGPTFFQQVLYWLTWPFRVFIDFWQLITGLIG